MRDIPKAVWSGSFTVFGVEVRCFVLDGGQRIIAADSVAELLEALGRPVPAAGVGDIEALSRWQQGLE